MEGHTEGSLGIDLGNSSSKATLGTKNQSGELSIIRVPYLTRVNDPQRLNGLSASDSQRDFVALAALEDGNLIEGRPARSKLHTFPIKTIIGHLAGVDLYDRLPEGDKLSDAVRAGEISRSAEVDVCLTHLRRVLDMSVARARRASILVTKVVLSYPVYFCSEEEYLDKFKNFYLELIWPMLEKVNPEIKVTWISEGQAQGLYVTERFVDANGSFSREQFLEPFRALFQGSSHLRLLVVDCGSSTSSIQNQYIWFDEDEGVDKGTSEYEADTQHGAIGGSYMTNCWVKDYIRRVASTFSAEDQVALLNDFEQKKYNIDLLGNQRITLRGTAPNTYLSLDPHSLEKAFDKAFADGLQVIKAEIDRVVRLGRDFGVVFCGGSYLNRGLYNLMHEHMERLEQTASINRQKIMHTFLSDHDETWSSAVSAGAAISVLRVPQPVEALKGAAIGAQFAWKTPNKWTGEHVAYVLLSTGHRVQNNFATWDFNTRDFPDGTILQLICCLDHERNHSQRATNRRRGPPRFGSKRRKQSTEPKSNFINLKATKSTIYDLGFSCYVRDLPPGMVRISLAGKDVDLLADGSPEDYKRLLTKESLVFKLRCCSVNSQTDFNQFHPKNKSWRLKLETCPAAKLVIVGEESLCRQPIWCTGCGEEIRSAGYECTVCTYRYRTCRTCLDALTTTHEHTLMSIDMRSSPESTTAPPSPDQ